MNAQQANIDNVAHNLANVNTTGFKKSRVEFEDLVYQQLRTPGTATSQETEAPVGLAAGLGSRPVATARNFTAGSLRATNNPLDRLRVAIDPQEAHTTAWDLADALARGAPPIIVRDHEVEHNYFYLDPCNLHPGQEKIVASRLAEELDKARASNEIIATSLSERNARRFAGLLRWPD